MKGRWEYMYIYIYTCYRPPEALEKLVVMCSERASHWKKDMRESGNIFILREMRKSKE